MAVISPKDKSTLNKDVVEETLALQSVRCKDEALVLIARDEIELDSNPLVAQFPQSTVDPSCLGVILISPN